MLPAMGLPLLAGIKHSPAPPTISLWFWLRDLRGAGTVKLENKFYAYSLIMPPDHQAVEAVAVLGCEGEFVGTYSDFRGPDTRTIV